MIDPVTGSIKTQTEWFGFPMAAVVEQSAIENGMNQHRKPHSNNWVFLHAAEKTVFGHL